MNRSARVSSLITVCSLLFHGVASHAYDMPALNLGFTSFLDGGPPAGPGFYFTEYLQYYHAERFTDKDGDNMKLPVVGGAKSARLDVYVSLSQLIYQSKQQIVPFGGRWGADLIVPFVAFDLEPDKFTVLKDNGAGLGDILVGPFIQWDPIMGEKGPIFMHRVEFQLLLPTGRYTDDAELNPGSNYFSFDPYWAATWWMLPRWSASWRVHYLWNDENDDPSKRSGAKSIQAGQAIHANFSTEFEAIEKKLHIGINGYVLDQLTNTEINDKDVGGRKEQVVAVGPGAVVHFSQNDHLFFNVYFEMAAENRPEGERVNLRWVHHF